MIRKCKECGKRKDCRQYIWYDHDWPGVLMSFCGKCAKKLRKDIEPVSAHD